MSVVGLDIGGANLKASTADGQARTRPFALWKRPHELRVELQSLLADWLPCDRLAVTMTGELCDCFANRGEGVRHILEAVHGLAPQIHVWNTRGQFVSSEAALTEPMSVASANWHALATYAGRWAPIGPAILIDIGSTTTDIIPLVDGRPTPTGRTDFERLSSKELVYTGVQRTPICALLEPGEGMAEFFATTLDVYLVLGLIDEDAANCQTADGRSATRPLAHARLARMLGHDAASLDDVRLFAERIYWRQSQSILDGLVSVADHMGHPSATMVVAGSGPWLALGAIQNYSQVFTPPRETLSLSEVLGPEVSSAACAVAAAALLAEQV
jgi:probable H4MPT-linked C1 transfer pathway protein